MRAADRLECGYNSIGTREKPGRAKQCLRAAGLVAAAGLIAVVSLARAPAVANDPTMSMSADSDEVRFASPEAAYEQGMGALKAHEPGIAVPALGYAARGGIFLADFYLARIYSIGSEEYVDHARAFAILKRLVAKYRAVDPYLDYRAPYVARAFVGLALYYKSGLPAIHVAQNLSQARMLLEYAASYFDDADAQFELARIYLEDESSSADHSAGKHWLSTLVKKGHAGAQAYLAELFWRGKKVKRKPTLSLALATLALETAPSSEKIWIIDTHHQIYCAASPEIRDGAAKLLIQMRRQYRHATRQKPVDPLDLVERGAVRTCNNGEIVPGSGGHPRPDQAGAAASGLDSITERALNPEADDGAAKAGHGTGADDKRSRLVEDTAPSTALASRRQAKPLGNAMGLGVREAGMVDESKSQ